MIIQKIFQKNDKEGKYHYITIRDNNNPEKTIRMSFNSYTQLKNILKNQKKYQDLFITKYSQDKVVDTIILDFDSNIDKKLVYYEVNKLKRYLYSKGLNSFIVDSTNKGYHIYIQIPPKGFKITNSEKNDNKLFNIFVEKLTNNKKFKFETLDSINTNAGFGGNIRMIGSIHPKTSKRCKIIEGSFEDNPSCYEPLSEGYEYVYEIFVDAYNLFMKKFTEEEKIKNDYLKHKKSFDFGNDFIKDNDLRELMPKLFGGVFKTFDKGYVYMQCPFHNDSNPSCLVTKEWFSCNACGSKGNIWTLHKEGHIDLFEEK